MITPSKLFHLTISGSGNVSGSNAPNSLFVQRSTAPVFAFTENTSPNVRSDQSDSATSLLSGRHIGGRGNTCPAGSFGAQRTLDVVASINSPRLLAAPSNTAAIACP